MRKQGTETLGTIYSIQANKGGIFYLRMLLSDTSHSFSAGKVSFADLRTVNGVVHDTYKEACRALGLLEDDILWHSVMEDAKQEKLPKQIRDLFVIIMIFTEVSYPKMLFEEFIECMHEDYEAKLLPPNNTIKELLRNMVLIEIEEQLLSTGNGALFKVNIDKLHNYYKNR